MRDRGSVVLIENNKVALIQRVRNGSVYYVFPGGGLEDGEDPSTCAKREALEELGVKVKINECLAKVDFHGTQYFFLAERIGGTFGTGQGEEFTRRDILASMGQHRNAPPPRCETERSCLKSPIPPRLTASHLTSFED